jgi:hypothetical protein
VYAKKVLGMRNVFDYIPCGIVVDGGVVTRYHESEAEGNTAGVSEENRLINSKDGKRKESTIVNQKSEKVWKDASMLDMISGVEVYLDPSDIAPLNLNISLGSDIVHGCLYPPSSNLRASELLQLESYAKFFPSWYIPINSSLVYSVDSAYDPFLPKNHFLRGIYLSDQCKDRLTSNLKRIKHMKGY